MVQSNEAKIKDARLREYMERKGLSAVVLGRQDNFAWFTCGGDNHVVTASDGGVASLVITRDKKYVVTSNIEAGRIRDEEVSADYEVIECPWHEEAESTEALIRGIVGGGRAASDSGQSRPAVAGLDADFAELKYSLTEEEMTRYRALGRDCSLVMTNVASVIERGQTEEEAAGVTANMLMAHGITPIVLLIAADGRIDKYRHPIYTDREINNRVMLVICGRRGGLICSLTRLVNFSKVSRELAEKHRACCAVDAAFILGTQVGVETGAIFRAAMDVYAKCGFRDEWKLHHQGGPTGYAGRDYKATPTRVSPASPTRRVLANQAYAWNPSITGTKSEDTILALESGPEIISAPVDWPTIKAEFKGKTVERAAILER